MFIYWRCLSEKNEVNFSELTYAVYILHKLLDIDEVSEETFISSKEDEELNKFLFIKSTLKSCFSKAYL